MMIAFVSPSIRRRRSWALVLAGLFFAAQGMAIEARPLPGELAGKKRAVILQPISTWQIELVNDRCRLARQFESSAGPGIVMIEQTAPGEVFDLTIAGPDIAGSRKGAWLYGGMRSDQEMRTINALEFAVAGYDTALAMSGVRIDDDSSTRLHDPNRVAAMIDPVAAYKMDRIVFQRSTAIVSFETGNMQSPFEALNDCSSKLLEGWGLDKEVHLSYTPPRMPDEQSYFRRLHHEFVNASGNRGNESLLRVRTIVNVDGSVRDCAHDFSLSSSHIQPDVCSEISQMTFEPATDAEGNPIASVHSVSYILSRFDPWAADAHGGRQD